MMGDFGKNVKSPWNDLSQILKLMKYFIIYFILKKYKMLIKSIIVKIKPSKLLTYELIK
jgi:hypothetical protein